MNELWRLCGAQRNTAYNTLSLINFTNNEDMVMKFIGIRRVFSTKDEGQYTTIGTFWDELSKIYGRKNLMGLGCNWTDNSIDYVMALKDGIIADANYEVDLPDEWITISGRTENLSAIYNEIYEDGSLLYEIEEFDDKGNCRIKYCR